MTRLIPSMILVALVSSTVGSMVACSNDESDADEPASTGGGGSTGTNRNTNSVPRGGSGGTTANVLPRGGASQSGVPAATGGAPRTTAVVGTGGRSGGIGGMNAAGFSNVDFNCMTGANCTAGCTATCPNAATVSYSCTCSGGQLSCDLAVCAGSLLGGACAAGVTSGTSCDSASDLTTCTPSSGSASVCVCYTKQWLCL